MHLLGRAGLTAAHFVRKALIITHIEPVLSAVVGPGLENSIEFLDQGLCQFIVGMVNDIPKAILLIKSRQRYGIGGEESLSL